MTPAAARASPVQHRADALHLCSRSEDRGDTFPEPAGIAPDSVAPVSTAPHSSPDLPQSTDRDNSSTAPDHPTTDAPSHAPEPGYRASESPGQDAGPSAPAGSETRSSTGTPAPAIPGSNSPASASAPATHTETARTTARNCRLPSPLCPPRPVHRAPETEAAGSP